MKKKYAILCFLSSKYFRKFRESKRFKHASSIEFSYIYSKRYIKLEISKISNYLIVK